MAKQSLQTRLTRKNANKERIADQVIKQPELLSEVCDGLSSEQASVKYGSAKVLRIIGQRAPTVLYPRINYVIDLLDSDNNIMRWEAIHLLGNLAAVDEKKKIDKILVKFFQPISGPVLITAANVVGSSAKIAMAKPGLTNRVTKELMQVENANYKTPMCRQVALGHVIEALDKLMPQIGRQTTVVGFVRRQLNSPRPATRNKAVRFLKKFT